MSLISALGALELGLIFSLVALGAYLSFRIINFPDLTVDGSLPLGAAVCAVFIVAGVNPFIATIAAFFAGCAAGLITALLNVRLKILHLLASILVMVGLYSVNLRIMGKPNIPLIGEETVFTMLIPEGAPDLWLKPLILLVLVILAKLILDWFLSSEAGLAMRATGWNPRMARAQGIATDKQTLLALALSNGLVALAGALYAQSQGGADTSMGIGTVVIGLAAVIVGETLITARHIFFATLACIVGAILYRFFIALALSGDFIGLQAQDLNLITSVLIALALLMPSIKRRLRAKRNSIDVEEELEHEVKGEEDESNV